MIRMDTFVIYVPSGEVLGAAEADNYKDAAEGVVNGVEWPPDTAAAKVNAARVTDSDYEVGDTINEAADGIEVVERSFKVAVHG